TFVVNTTADTADAVPGDGRCEDSGGACSLRAAVQEANALAGPDTIQLGAATYVLSGAAGDDLAASGDLDITGDLTLTGAGTASTIIDGGGVDRVLDIDPSGAGVSVTISYLTVRGGGGVCNSGGTATLVNVTLGENSAPIGGGISNPAGTVTLTNTLVANSTGGNCSGAISSGGNNLDSGSTCAFAGAGDLSNRDPLLGVLASNGGTTQTRALSAGSPAIDAGSNAACP